MENIKELLRKVDIGYHVIERCRTQESIDILKQAIQDLQTYLEDFTMEELQ